MEPKDQNKSGHDCLKVQGRGKECSNCQVMQKGFCQAFLKVLRKITSNLDGSYSSRSVADRNAIIAETVSGIWKGLNNYQGKSGASFSTWAWSIYKNKRNDYLRQQFRQKHETPLELETNEYQLVQQHEAESPEIKINRTMRALKLLLSRDSSGCIQLYLDLFQTFQAGKSQDDLAQDYRIKPNTLNQRKRRCLEVVQQLMSEG